MEMKASEHYYPCGFVIGDDLISYLKQARQKYFWNFQMIFYE
jgi:hypothetical protein